MMKTMERKADMKPILEAAYLEALGLIPGALHAEFRRFIDTGEASAEFLAFIEQDDLCKRACDIVLRADTEVANMIRAIASETESTTGSTEVEKVNATEIDASGGSVHNINCS